MQEAQNMLIEQICAIESMLITKENLLKYACSHGKIALHLQQLTAS
jgi:hypothetical protein